MQASTPIFVCAGLAALAAAGFLGYRARGPARAGTTDGASAAIERLTHEVTHLTARQASLEASLERLSRTTGMATPSGGRVSSSDVEAAVARYMQERAAEQPAVAAEPAAKLPVAPPSREVQLAAALARLDDPTLGELELQALWREYATAGLTADLIAAFEARAEAAPNDPDAQVAAAGAYLAKIFEVGNSPEAGVWATKADKAFDRALALDDHHWDARFEKAVSLSFWPPVFGKQGEAIRQFEILAKQQEGLPAEPRHAETHLLLGNMYRQIGEEERALAAWHHGLELHPGNEALLGQLEVFSNDG